MTPEQNALFDLVTWDFPGAAIEAESFRRIEAEVPPEQRARFSPSEWHIARRLVHTTADFSILPHLRFSGDPVEAGRAALRRGAYQNKFSFDGLCHDAPPNIKILKL